MKLHQLFEEDEDDFSDEQKWIWKAFPEDLNSSTLYDGDWDIKDGKICFSPEAGTQLLSTAMKMRWNGELPYPFGEFKGSLYSRGKLTSLKNIPTKVTRALSLENNSIEKIDQKIECSLLRLNGNKIKSVEGIHKFVKCRIILIDDNPIEGSILDILKIEGLEEVDATKSIEHDRLSHAMHIIGRFSKLGTSGIVKAQRALLDNDLDEFA